MTGPTTRAGRYGVAFRPLEPVVVTVGVLVFVWLTIAVVLGGPVTGLDQRVHHRFDGGVDPGGAVSWAGHLGDVGVTIGVLAIVAIVTAQVSWRLWPVLLAVGNGVVMSVVVLGMKYAVGRLGPGLSPGDRPDYPGYFPSGHTASAAVCIGTAAYLLWRLLGGRASRWPGRVRPAPVGLAVGLLAGLAEGTVTVLSDNHWVTDVVASLALSTVILTCGFVVARRVR